jgi:hypothetical protein
MGKFLKYSNTLLKVSKKTRQLGLLYVNEKGNSIVNRSGISMTRKQREIMFHTFFEKGVLDMETKHGGYIVKCAFEDTPVAFMVEEYNNISLYYRKYCGEKVETCGCGRLFLVTGKNHKYCKVCWKKKEREIKRNYMRNIRKNVEVFEIPESTISNID